MAPQTESRLSHLDWLEAEAIHILREGVAEGRNPVMLFSAGKDSTVLAHLALRAFYPSPPPFPLLHVDSTWEFRSLLAFRDAFAKRHGFELVVYANEAGRAAGLNPFEHGDAYTSAMRTDALKQALNRGGYDIVFGGARRDEERSRAKERIFSVRNEHHGWEPRQQRPELWRIFNTRLSKGQSLRVFPLSNWTETDIWTYALSRQIELAPLYFAEPRPVIERNGAVIVVDEPA
jgi:sulfate adenylyltransferase subunit 2